MREAEVKKQVEEQMNAQKFAAYTGEELHRYRCSNSLDIMSFSNIESHFKICILSENCWLLAIQQFLSARLVGLVDLTLSTRSTLLLSITELWVQHLRQMESIPQDQYPTDFQDINLEMILCF